MKTTKMAAQIVNHSATTMETSILSTEECIFFGVNSVSDLFNLFQNTNCYRHSLGMSAFLFLANLVIFLLGLVGNCLVIYVVIWKIRNKTASSIFILNLAIADLLVIIGCIPATLMANLITPWFMGQIMCKIMAYGQGVSVFCAVFSLVAITFDRFRAIHKSTSGYQMISLTCALKIVGVIWILGLVVTIPWAVVFKVVNEASSTNNTEANAIPNLPFCMEIWETKTQELSYFILIHVLACYVLPLILITICDVVIWRSVRKSNFVSTPSQLNSSVSIQETQRKRKMRVLKMFTALTFTFFLFWLPLYVITLRVKIFYTEGFQGTPTEQQLLSILIPISQLLGSCNSCVNPVLYALLNQTFRESFRQVFECISCSALLSRSPSQVDNNENAVELEGEHDENNAATAT